MNILTEPRKRYVCMTHERFGDTPDPCAGLGGIMMPCEVAEREDVWPAARQRRMLTRIEAAERAVIETGIAMRIDGSEFAKGAVSTIEAFYAWSDACDRLMHLRKQMEGA